MEYKLRRAGVGWGGGGQGEGEFSKSYFTKEKFF